MYRKTYMYFENCHPDTFKIPAINFSTALDRC